MPRYTNLLTLVVVLLASWPLLQTTAHSTHAPLLKRALNPQTLALEILPRRDLNSNPSSKLSKRSPFTPSNVLRFDDSLRLTISAFDDVFHLHLRPNLNLIHPNAKVSYYKLNSEGQSVLDRTEPLLQETVLVYEGEVIDESHTARRLKEDIVGVEHLGHPSELGWARIMVHDQGDSAKGISPTYEGAFTAHGVTYHISTKENYLKHKHELDPDATASAMIDDNLVIWRDSDAMTPEEEHFVKTGSPAPGPIDVPQSCGHDALDFNRNPAVNPVLKARPPHWLSVLLSKPSELPTQHVRHRRQGDIPTGNGGMRINFGQFIGQTAGCPRTQKVIYMGVAADCEYVAKQNGEEAAKRQILRTWNTASALYKSSINVSLGISELQVKSANCPTTTNPDEPWNIACRDGIDLNDRLSLFSAWRGVGSRPDDGNGLWHLMSGCPTGVEVGIAWLGTICRTTTSGSANRAVSGTAVSTSGRQEWQVVAHEIGHNFGAIHDCTTTCAQGDLSCCPLTSNTCATQNQFIMSPVAQDGDKVFSPCSLGNICSLMSGVAGDSTITTCLVDPDPSRPGISEDMCGNGIVEGNEQCDPGLGIESSCCDPTTCRFRTGAVCDPSNESCCTAQCRFAPATTICRESIHPTCDRAETCTGNSGACPADQMAPNGQSCGAGELKCASGRCTSIAEQCRTVGATMNLSEPCPDRSDRSCQISCQDPERSNACLRLTSLLVDGSPCGFGGSCVKGQCQSANFIETAKAWYVQNLQIAIPVTIVAGLIFLLLLWGLFSCIRRCMRSNNSARPARPTSTIIPPMVQNTGHRRMPSPTTPYRNIPPVPPRSQYARVPPPAAHDRQRSGGSVSYNYNANNHANWVDDRTFNGPAGGQWR
ncbi:zinc metalloprotease [Coprinopsis marcescibilis]|uniref:Disintegrin and metalloproteinase domain-containing protein B n=1 Tax=Coprinopsis marcescibilis TaxID=230819 RepID=A0A5C3KVG2_COPMA|nr:zinc metalloprotease [Coprinopsis marcescibilis]